MPSGSWVLRKGGLLPAFEITVQNPDRFLRRAGALLVLLLLVWAGGVKAAWPTLPELKFSDDLKGTRDLLHSLARDAETNQRLEKLVTDLDDDDYGTRQEATIALMNEPSLPRSEFRELAEKANAEVRARLAQILRVNTPDKTERFLGAAVQVVKLRNLKEIGSELIAAVESVESDNRSLWSATQAAMGVCVTLKEREALIRMTRSTSPLARACAVRSLAGLGDKSATDELKRLLSDSDDRVKLEAAEALRAFRIRDCLPAFVELLSSEEPRVRFLSSVRLRKLTNMSFKYRANHLPAERNVAYQAWLAWLDQNGATAKLSFEG